jgi:preprotein translocase subunit SecB
MADESTGTGTGNGNGAAESVAPQPSLQILTQYVRDLSFENIAAQMGVGSEGKPDVKVQVNIDAQKRPQDRYQVALKLKVNSSIAEASVFIL